MTAEQGFLVIGRMIRPHGIRGEMSAAVHTQVPERFTWLEHIYLAREPNDPDPSRHEVLSVRFHKGNALIRLEGYERREDLEVLRGMWLLVPDTEAVPLEEGEVFHHDLEGLQVVTEDGESLGTLVEILETGANEVFVVQGQGREILLPNIEEVVLQVDLDAGTMLVHLMPGLRDE